MSTGLIESARNFVAGLLELGHTRFELFGTELREELARLAAAVIGGLAVLVLGALALAFGGAALVLYVSEANRVAAAVCVAVFFLVAAGLVAWLLHALAAAKPRAFDATISELQRDLSAIRK
jgi:uncharacterized membrane protein YqjE